MIAIGEEPYRKEIRCRPIQVGCAIRPPGYLDHAYNDADSREYEREQYQVVTPATNPCKGY